jgi:hypothetical protein
MNAGTRYSLHLQSLGEADAVSFSKLIEKYLEQPFPPDRLAVVPCTIAEGISYAAGEPLRAALERAGASVEMVES